MGQVGGRDLNGFDPTIIHILKLTNNKLETKNYREYYT